jgi:hypothetical protein
MFIRVCEGARILDIAVDEAWAPEAGRFRAPDEGRSPDGH